MIKMVIIEQKQKRSIEGGTHMQLCYVHNIFMLRDSIPKMVNILYDGNIEKLNKSMRKAYLKLGASSVKVTLLGKNGREDILNVCITVDKFIFNTKVEQQPSTTLIDFSSVASALFDITMRRDIRACFG